MKRDVQKFINTWSPRRFRSFLDTLTFPRILLIWVTMVLFFGWMYYFFTDDFSYLYYMAYEEVVVGLSDAIYFSFVAATTTGFGDIIPVGFFKIIAIFEVLSGLLLLAIVTSKLISIKQDIIMSEMYEISFYERFSRLRSSLLLTRQNINKIIKNIKDGVITKRNRVNIDYHLSTYVETLKEIKSVFLRRHDYAFVKKLDPVNAELIFNSSFFTFDKIDELLGILNKEGYNWKKESTIRLLNSSMKLVDFIFLKFSFKKNFNETTKIELIKRKNNIFKSIKQRIKGVD